MTAFSKFAFIATCIFALGTANPASAKSSGGGNGVSNSSHASTVSQGQKQKTNIRKSGGDPNKAGKPFLYYQFR